MDEIEAWLDAEEANYPELYQAWLAGDFDDEPPVRGFRCNWDTTKRLWRAGDQRVEILVVDGIAIGLLAGNDILEIHPDFRRSGFGRVLAEFAIALAYDEGQSVMEIEIAPSTAVPFWQSMGFTLVPGRQGSGDGDYAYRILHRAFPLEAGTRVPFEVSFYSHEERFGGSDPKPFAQYVGLGEQLPNGTLQLPERACCFRPDADGFNDDFIKIVVDGQQLHFDKVKRPSSKIYGVERDPGYIYYIDRIRLN
jgi:GNAT superfamily N-acetyltransferase